MQYMLRNFTYSTTFSQTTKIKNNKKNSTDSAIAAIILIHIIY